MALRIPDSGDSCSCEGKVGAYMVYAPVESSLRLADRAFDTSSVRPIQRPTRAE